MAKVPEKIPVRTASDLIRRVLPDPAPIALERVQGITKVTANTSVGFFSLVYAWLYWNLAGETVHAISGGNPMDSKLWYTSKTLWVNALAILWHILPTGWGVPQLEGQTLVVALVIVNALLRLVTKKPVTFT